MPQLPPLRRGAKEDCCRMAMGPSGLEGGDILIPPLSLPTDVGSAAGVQAWATFARGWFCAPRVAQQRGAVAGHRGALPCALLLH